MKIRQLLNIKNCEYQAYINNFNLYTKDKKNIIISNIYKYLIKNKSIDDNLNRNEEFIKGVISEKLDNTYFVTNGEKNDIINIIYVNYKRYIDKINFQILNKDVKDNVNINGNDIEVKADIIYQHKGYIEIVKIKTSKPILSAKARTEDNKPENDIELYCMWLLGKQLYPGEVVVSSYHHISGKKDNDKIGKEYYNMLLNNDIKTINRRLEILDANFSIIEDKKEKAKIKREISTIMDVINYNNTDGNNIVSCSDFNENRISDTIKELFNIKLDENSEKKCDFNRCSVCDYRTLCENKPTIKLEEVIQKESIQKEVNLTDEQKEVYDFNNGICKVLAGAGSGKSTTMAMRILRLIKEGCNPKDMLLITFTEKGAKELRDKVLKLANFYKVFFNYSDLEVFTFNSFGQKLVDKEWEWLGYEKKPDLAININTTDLLIEIDNSSNIEWLNSKNPLMNMKNYKGSLNQMRDIFSKIKAFNITKDELKDYLTNSNLYTIKDYDKAVEECFEIYQQYNDMLFNNNLIEYQDQILLANKILQNKLEQYGYKHIVVDEYQDTDKSQVEILKTLVNYSNFESLMVVGDVNQSIFGFRNTTPENIINFEKDFKNVEIKFMINNFRCTPEIVELANAFINQNDNDNNIIAKAFKDNGKNVVLNGFDTLKDEKEFQIQTIKDAINRGTKLTDICYIGRTKKDLLLVQELLQKEGISSILKVAETYISNSRVQSILNLANYFKDTTKNYYLWEFFKINANDRLNELVDKYEFEIKDCDNTEQLMSMFFSMIDEFVTDKIAIDFIERIKEMSFYTLKDLLAHLYKVVLYNDNTAIEKDDKIYNAVTLTTVHGSKGLEWNIVVSGLNDFDYEDKEEDRRLIYVDITRAKDELYLTYNNNMDKRVNKGKHVKCIDELQECLNEAALDKFFNVFE